MENLFKFKNVALQNDKWNPEGKSMKTEMQVKITTFVFPEVALYDTLTLWDVLFYMHRYLDLQNYL